MASAAEPDYSNTSTELNYWFGLSSPYFMFAVVGIYLLLILKCLPAYMKNRKPYDLKTFIAVYNVSQVIACIYTVISIYNVTSSTLVLHFWKCSIFEPNTRSEYLFNRISYFTFWLKLVELTETIVFVLRKKQNQVSFLHVFHHCTTVTLIYVLLKYYRGGSALYPLFLNTNVHIIMYSYYFLAAVCDKRIVRRLLPIKKSITTIQMIQFTMILIQVATMVARCQIPIVLCVYYMICICVIFYGFYDFYKKSYTRSEGHQHKAKKVAHR